MLIAILEDNAFRKRMNVPYAKRWTVRALAYNEEGKLCFLRIKGSDSFGKRNHLETIGGGVENDESLEEALHREVMEEIGYECEIVEELGVVVDHYNLINRENISTYFVVKLTNYIGETKRSEEEEKLISGIEFLEEKEALQELSKFPKHTVNELVHRRDYYALKHYMKKKNKGSNYHKDYTYEVRV
ncbi:MAG: NUDIX hydrolase [Erysipelotrichia bacterium]|nr:NUDIX hydrolase [Erysipelotrichia bacterium]NCC54414.1 NUDIX hydrolase [Erysipelotrichia bacterium]